MTTLSGLLTDWELPSAPPVPISQDLPYSITAALARRGITTQQEAEHFLKPTWQGLEDPFALPDIEPALEHLHSAIREKRKVFIVGDYDVDGTTSAALLGDFFQKIGHEAFYLYIPNRFTEGYGVSDLAVDKALAEGYRLFIAVDCGTKDGPRLARLQAAGVPVIVIDHHAMGPGDPFPPAIAFVNPQRSDAAYPNPYLSAGGVTFKLLSAYIQRYGLPETWLEEWLQLVAISLLADIMPLVGENRLLVQLGLRQLESSARPGLAALMKRAGIHPPLRSRDVVFSLAPRLNAPGRLQEARFTLYLLLQQKPSDKLNEVADYLDQLNRHRQKLQETTLQAAFRSLEARWPGITADHSALPTALVVADSAWNKGIIGLVAAKLNERFNRPAVVFTQDAKTGLFVGSARSPEGVPLYEILENFCKPYLVRFGGHNRAAGLSLQPQQLEGFTAALMKAAAAYVRPRPIDALDAVLPVQELTVELIQWVERFEPIGPGNPAPRFLIEGFQLLALQENQALFTHRGRLYEASLSQQSPSLVAYLRTRLRQPLSIIATPRLQPSGKVVLRLRDIVPK